MFCGLLPYVFFKTNREKLMRREPKTFNEYNQTPRSMIRVTAKTQHVLFSDQLPIPEPNLLQKLSIPEVEKKCAFKWTDGLVGPKQFLQECIAPSMNLKKPYLFEHPNGQRSTFDYDLVHDTLNINSTYLALAKINDEIGYGVFYVGPEITAQTLKENPYLLVIQYTGEFADNDEKGDSVYSAGKLPNNHFGSLCIDAFRYGNLARFINHLPSKQQVAEYEFALGLQENQIKTANLALTFLTQGEYPCFCFKVCAPINYGDQLGYSYQDSYWFTQELQQQVMPKYFYAMDSFTVIPSYFLRRRETIPIHFRDQENNEQYTEDTLQTCYEILQGKQPCMIVIHQTDLIEKLSFPLSIVDLVRLNLPFTLLTPKELIPAIQEALLRHGHSVACPIASGIYDQKDQPDFNIRKQEYLMQFIQSYQLSKQVTTEQLEILRLVANADFVGYERPESPNVIDAIYTAKNLQQKTNTLSKLAGVGLFLHSFKKTILIEAINDEWVSAAIHRLQN